MAREFSSDYLENTNAILTAVPITICGWFKTNDNSKSQTVLVIYDKSNSDNYFWLAHSGGTGSFKAIARDDVNNFSADAGGTVNNDQWHHACGVFSANDSRACFLDGGNKGTNANTAIPLALDETRIGSLAFEPPNEFFMDGNLAEAAIWNVALTDAEVALLAKGYSPLFVRPQNLVSYWPLVRSLNDIVGGYNLSASGTTVAAHSRIIYQSLTHILSKLKFEINVYDSVSVSENLEINKTGILEINVSDSVSVSEDVTAKISPLKINVYDNVKINETRIVGSEYNANLAGFGWLDFDKTRDVCYGTAATSGTFTSFDISDPANPTVLHQINIPNCEGIVIEGYVAYVCSYGSRAGIYAVDISDPENMSVLDSITDSDYFDYSACVEIVGDYLIVGNYAEGFNKLTIVNKTDPENLVVSTVYEHSTYANRVIYLKALGKILFASARGVNSLVAFNASNPLSLSPLDSISDQLNNPAGLSFSSENSVLAVCSRSNDRVVLFGISDPSDLQYLGYCTSEDYLDYCMVNFIIGKVCVSTAYSDDNLAVLDISNPASSSIINYIIDEIYLKGADDIKFRQKDGLFYVTSNSGKRLTIVDIPLITSVTVRISLLKINVSDSVELTEDISVERTAPEILEINVYDSLEVAESLSAKFSLYKIDNYDEISVSESLTAKISPLKLSVSDDLGVSESLTARLMQLKVDVADSVEVTDVSIVKTSPLKVSVADSLEVSESLEALMYPLSVQVFDSLSVTDNISVMIPGLELSILTFDILVLTESVSVVRLPDWQLPVDDDTCTWSAPTESDICTWSRVTGGDSANWSKV